MDITEEVLDNYLISELCKQKDIQNKIMGGSLTGEEIKEEIVDEVREEYEESGYSLEKKFNLVREFSDNPDHMYKMFKYCSWEKQSVSIGDLGTTLPNAMGLPPEVISGSLPEVVNFVNNAEPGNYRSIDYIEELRNVPEILDRFLTTVIVPGEILRRKDRMIKQHGQKDWNIEDAWGAVHDANHRTIAKILAYNLEEIECFIGRPKNSEIYQHIEL